jgi:hypothetical protein
MKAATEAGKNPRNDPMQSAHREDNGTRQKKSEE